MDLKKAEGIYNNPKGHSKEELHECLGVLNSQPRELTELQFLCILDAHNRLGVALTEGGSLEDA